MLTTPIAESIIALLFVIGVSCAVREMICVLLDLSDERKRK